jgi:hypothetical protein
MATVQIEFEYSSYDPGDPVRGVVRVAASAQAAPPLRQEIAIVIDVSGSMFPVLGLVKAVCEFALSRFVGRASCALVTFSDVAEVIEPMTFLTPSVVEQYTRRLHTLTAGGQTNLAEGLGTACGLLSAPGQSVLVITDGRPTVGPTRAADISTPDGHPLYVVAIGTQCDDALLAQLAHRSGGMFADAVQLDTVVSATGGLFGAIFGTALTDVTLCFNADSLSTLPSRQTAFATTVSIGPMFTSEEVFVPFEIDSNQLRFVTAQLYAGRKLIVTHESAVPFEQGRPVPNSWVGTQLLRAEVARLLHAEPLDVEAASLLLERCAQDSSHVGAWLTKRLTVALEGSGDRLPILRQELTRARSTAYDDESDWLVPPCMRAFSHEARASSHDAFALHQNTPRSPRSSVRLPTFDDLDDLDDLDVPALPPMLQRAETQANE